MAAIIVTIIVYTWIISMVFDFMVSLWDNKIAPEKDAPGMIIPIVNTILAIRYLRRILQ